MDKLQLPQSKLLYAISQAYRKRMIDQTEKRLLKQKMVTDNVQIFQVLERNFNEKQLIDELIALVRAPPEYEEIIESPSIKKKESLLNSAEEQASSPWGEFLRRKKMNRQHQKNNEVHQIKNLIKPERAS